MLALTRKKGESLVLNNNIEVTLLEIRGDQVKLGIKAPKMMARSAASLLYAGSNCSACCPAYDERNFSSVSSFYPSMKGRMQLSTGSHGGDNL